ncbi:MAG: hypothetical protein PH343_05605 [Nitrospira sp.]|nr:hypothetical protein [Nitrospira sp.]
MPYITKKDRTLYNGYIHAFELMHAANCTAGELNYLFTGLMHAVIKKQGKKYDVFNKIAGVISCMDKEIYRMLTAPYEDVKRMENGPVSELDK